MLLCSQQKTVFSPNTRVQARNQVVQVDALHLQLWLYPLEKCNISNTNMLINSELRAVSITRHSCEWQRARAADERHVTVSHLNSAVSLWLERSSGTVGATVRVLQCFPLVGTHLSAAVQKLTLTAYSLRIVASV